MSLTDFYPLQQSGAVLVYDVRNPIFYSMGHIDGASNWPKSAFDSQLAARETEIRKATLAKRPVVIYCTDAACPDARYVANRLAALGHNACVLDGGWDAWSHAGLASKNHHSND